MGPATGRWGRWAREPKSPAPQPTEAEKNGDLNQENWEYNGNTMGIQWEYNENTMESIADLLMV